MAKLFKNRPADPPHVVTGTGPSGPTEDWDSTDNAPRGKWLSVDKGSGPTDCSMNVTGEFPDGPDR